MKKWIVTILAFAFTIGFTSTPVYAYNYEFSSVAESDATHGKSTSDDSPINYNPLITNERRNKDVAYFPPEYGVFSGDIPTEPTSWYHSNDAAGSSYLGSNADGGDTVYSATSNVRSSETNLPDGIYTTSVAASANTKPKYYQDGSIGSLYITKLKKTIKVYEGESLENMKKGAAHFNNSSAWDGNCCFAGHNRGTNAYFSFVKDLSIGDTITYTTKYGKRAYKVFSKEKVRETDTSCLGWSSENIITLITCIENVPELRWCVQAKEIK